MTVFEFDILHELTQVIQNIENPWACYVLYQNKPIPRLGKLDEKGILYIGKADNLYNRVASLQKSVLNNCDNDSVPKIKGHQSLSKKVFRVQRFLDTSKMTIKVFILPSFDSIMYAESYLLEDYVHRFGELPPLNGQYGKFEFQEAKEYLDSHDIKLDYY